MANSIGSMRQFVSLGASLGALGIVAIAAPAQAQGERIDSPEAVTPDLAEMVQPKVQLKTKAVALNLDRPSVSTPESFPTEIFTAEVPQVASTVSIA